MKVDARELRIGNLILFNDDSTIFEVEEICDGGYSVKNKNEATWIEKDMFSFIKITEELLLKMGFLYDENKGYSYIDEDGEKQTLKDDPYFYINYGGNLRFIYSINKKTAYIGIKCEYVHTLQNIFYLVSNGKELIL